MFFSPPDTYYQDTFLIRTLLKFRTVLESIVLSSCLISLPLSSIPAPSPLGKNDTTINAINDNRFHITWSEPAELNGQLIYYKVVVYNQRTQFNDTRTISPSNPREVDLTGLSE